MSQKFIGEFWFSPVTKKSQELMCKFINLPLINEVKHGNRQSLKVPSQLYTITADGNCLFRALSYVITGRQSYHRSIRGKIVTHIRKIENLLLPHLNMPLDSYLEHSRMASEGSWGSDIEIFAACSLLSTDIYVYTKVGQSFKWQKFSTTMLNRTSPANECAIYLHHTNGVHYDVILDVGEMLPNKYILNVSKARQKRKDCSKGSECSVGYQPIKKAKLCLVNDCKGNDCIINNVKQNSSTNFLFSPIDKNTQKNLSTLLDLPLEDYVSYCHDVKLSLHKPSKVQQVLGDGNCLFRALSYVITGRQSYHCDIRRKIVLHMREIENLLLPHINMSLDSYLEQSGMTNEGSWGTDIEIFTACSLLSTDIYVYTKVGEHFKWQKFSCTMLNGISPKYNGAIYLQQTNGIHYDVVLEASPNVSNSFNSSSETTLPETIVNSYESQVNQSLDCNHEKKKFLSYIIGMLKMLIK